MVPRKHIQSSERLFGVKKTLDLRARTRIRYPASRYSWRSYLLTVDNVECDNTIALKNETWPFGKYCSRDHLRIEMNRVDHG